ncbi:MAG: hypothetical protein KGZ71_01850 [Desulfobulbaceae bacterium]|nr:hypothetical protein [Desulfobulbaceae bacterium]
MNRILGLILVLCVVFASTQALQAGEPQTKEGTKALFWGFNGLSDLSIDNSTIGFLYNISDGVGLWGALGLNIGSSKIDDNDHLSTTGVDFAVGAKLNMFQTEPVAMFISPMVTIGTSSTEDKSASSTFIDSEMTLGIGAAIGAEWWFANNVSFSASTFLGFVTETMTEERGENKDEHTKTNIGTMANYGAHFTLSFYFR